MINNSDILNATILIVDDQKANVQLLEQMLREAGYQCITSTTDPHAVCALHRDNRYDLILLDLQIPGMDGFQVMEGLKEIETDGYVPILVITAQPGHKLRALTDPHLWFAYWAGVLLTLGRKQVTMSEIYTSGAFDVALSGWFAARLKDAGLSATSGTGP